MQVIPTKQFKEVNAVSEEKKSEVLESVSTALEAIPEEFRASVSKSLTHDIGIIARTIDMVTTQAS